MSLQTMIRPKPKEKDQYLNVVPPLQSGDRLSRPEFERRYHAHPEIKKAELVEGVVYEHLEPDENGILKSEVFPGLWLKAEALWENDLAEVLAVLQQGTQSPEHDVFAAELASRKESAS
jgi:hypothetical protein